MAGVVAHMLGVNAAAGGGGGSVTLSAVTVAVDSASSATSYNYSLTGLPAGTKVVILLILGAGPNLSTRSVSSVTADDGSVAAAVGSNSTRFPIAAYAITGVTDTDVGGTVTFSGSMNGAWVGYYVITDTTQTTYHSRSGATASAGTNGADITSAAITIPTGGVGVSLSGPNGSSAVTWTVDAGSVSEDYDADPAGTPRISAAHALTTATTTFTASTATNTGHAILAFSWGP